jgi:uncharacterized protein (TIGR00255 family)
MINSMTGYGEAQDQINGATYTAEIKAVNNRYLKTSVKLPEAMAFLEEDIDKLLRKNLSRGTVNYVLRVKNAPAKALLCVDEKVLRDAVKKLSKIAASAKVDCRIDISNLLAVPGILGPVSPDEKTAEQIKKKVLRITRKAIDQLKQMRAAEGAVLAADLDDHCKAISKGLAQIRARSSVVLRQYQKKLKKRVDELLANAKLKLDKETLAREVAVYAERSDISEEVARLDSHLQQFIESCRAKGPKRRMEKTGNAGAGRRLDFISQEMLREANTIASKALDTEIIRRVVDIKCRIDRVKEQVQNIE